MPTPRRVAPRPFAAVLVLAACGQPSPESQAPTPEPAPARPAEDANARGAAPPRVEQLGGPTMGSTWELKLPAGTAPLAAVRAAVEAELAAFDAAFSAWRDDSEIQRVNAHRDTAPVPVGARFAAVLQRALDVAAATEGAYDPTVKPLSALFRAAKADPQHRLDPVELAAARARVGHRHVRGVAGAVVKARADVELDLDGIAAGAACDAIAQRLDELGVRSFYLSVTGEILCRGEKAPGVPWVIGVVDPRADASGGDVAFRTLPLRDAALCTSGDYRNAFVAGGRLVHHVFDPRTGSSAAAGVASASVLAGSAAVADALGTALLVLGEQDARRLWPALQGLGARAALLLLPDGERGLRAVELAWPRDE
jgi:thiamine biosynthesis lipoprotein